MINFNQIKRDLINNREVSNDVLINSINELTTTFDLLPHGALEEEGNSGLQSILLTLMLKTKVYLNN